MRKWSYRGRMGSIFAYLKKMIVNCLFELWNFLWRQRHFSRRLPGMLNEVTSLRRRHTLTANSTTTTAINNSSFFCSCFCSNPAHIRSTAAMGTQCMPVINMMRGVNRYCLWSTKNRMIVVYKIWRISCVGFLKKYLMRSIKVLYSGDWLVFTSIRH